MTRGKARSRDEWRQILNGLQSSGLTQKQYAEQVGCHPSAFGWWRNRLKRVDASGTPQAKPGAVPAGFVELCSAAPVQAVRIEDGVGTVVTFATLPPPEYILALLRRQ